MPRGIPAKAVPADRKKINKKVKARELDARLKDLDRNYQRTGNAVTASQANPNRPLTEKMKLFVKHWAAGETILTASYRAGYHDRGTYAYRLAKDPAILKLYEEEKRKYEIDSSMTRQRVIDGLLEAVEMAKLISEPGSMISGWREIGKMCGYYAPVEQKITVEQTNPLAERLNRLSDAELLKLIQDDSSNVIDVEATVIES